MISQDDNGDSSATTRSAVSAGAINITNGASQTQDLTGLSRDTANTNGTVAKTPEVNAILHRQADTMQAAQAAGQTVAQGIGAYADNKRDAALDTAKKALNSGDLDGAGAALADYSGWKEGGDSRAILQAAGGGLIGELGGSGFGAFGGAAGAGLSSKFAPQAKDAANAIADATGSSLMGSIGGNVLSGLAGAAVGGTAAAAGASNVNLYNQGHDKNESEATREESDIQSRAAKERAAVGVGSIEHNENGSLVVATPVGLSAGMGGGPKVPPNLQAFTNPAQGPVIPSDWVSQPGRTPGSTIYTRPELTQMHQAARIFE
jgi:filamentous hemagglutinin